MNTRIILPTVCLYVEHNPSTIILSWTRKQKDPAHGGRNQIYCTVSERCFSVYWYYPVNTKPVYTRIMQVSMIYREHCPYERWTVKLCKITFGVKPGGQKQMSRHYTETEWRWWRSYWTNIKFQPTNHYIAQSGWHIFCNIYVCMYVCIDNAQDNFHMAACMFVVAWLCVKERGSVGRWQRHK